MKPIQLNFCPIFMIDNQVMRNEFNSYRIYTYINSVGTVYIVLRTTLQPSLYEYEFCSYWILNLFHWKSLTFLGLLKWFLMAVWYWDMCFKADHPLLFMIICMSIIPSIWCYVWRVVWYMAINIIALVDWLKMCNCFFQRKSLPRSAMSFVYCFDSVLELMNTTPLRDIPWTILKFFTDGCRLNNSPPTTYSFSESFIVLCCLSWEMNLLRRQAFFFACHKHCQLVPFYGTYCFHVKSSSFYFLYLLEFISSICV